MRPARGLVRLGVVRLELCPQAGLLGCSDCTPAFIQYNVAPSKSAAGWKCRLNRVGGQASTTAKRRAGEEIFSSSPQRSRPAAAANCRLKGNLKPAGRALLALPDSRPAGKEKKEKHGFSVGLERIRIFAHIQCPIKHVF